VRNFTIGEPMEIDQWNLITGLAAQMRNDWSVLVGFGTPIVSSSFREFDGELRVAVNKYFGCSARNR
jgi:hypothetical protein